MAAIRARALGAGAVLLLLAACGSSSSGGSAAASPAGGGGAASSAPSSAPAGTVDAGGSVGAFCGLIKDQRAALTGTQLSTLLTSGSPAAWKAYLTQVTTLNQKLADVSPAEIKPSVLVLQATAVELASTIAAAQYEPKNIAPAKIAALVRDPKRAAASQLFSAYVRTNCGIDLTKVG